MCAFEDTDTGARRQCELHDMTSELDGDEGKTYSLKREQPIMSSAKGTYGLVA